MAAVQDVEHAVGEDERSRQWPPARQLGRGHSLSRNVAAPWRTDCRLRGRARPGRGSIDCGLHSPGEDPDHALTLCGIPPRTTTTRSSSRCSRRASISSREIGTGRKDEAVLACSPLGKVLFIRTERGALCESEAIMGYIEAAWRSRRCCPPMPGERAKLRELVTLHRPAPRARCAPALRPGLLRRRGADRREQGSASASSSSRTSPRSSAWRSSHPTSAARPSPRPTARPGSACRWSRCRAGSSWRGSRRRSGIDWKGYARMIAQRPAAQKVDADRKDLAGTAGGSEGLSARRTEDWSRRSLRRRAGRLSRVPAPARRARTGAGP